jgi:uncharacterized membrane protein YGL010W
MASPEPKLRISPLLERYFSDYAEFHQTEGNKWFHMFGIPMIVIGTFGLLGTIGGAVLWVASLSWYLFLDWKIAVPFGVNALGLYFLGRELPLPLLWSLFILGWIFQFVGHYHYEKKSPAFMKNVEHLLIGPLWVFARFVGFIKDES